MYRNEVYIHEEEPNKLGNDYLFIERIEKVFTNKRSNKIRPSKLICLFSRRPNCFD